MSTTEKRTKGPSPRGGVGGPRAGRVEKPKHFKRAMGQLLRYIGPYRWMILGVWALAIASTVFIILGPRLLGSATDELFAGIMRQISGKGSVDFEAIGRILLTVLALYGISALFSYLQGFVMSGITAKITYRLRRDIQAKINTLPLAYYDRMATGDVLSRITNDVDIIGQTLNQSMVQMITSVTSLLGIMIMMLTISWQMTLVALVMIPVSMGSIFGLVKASQKYFKRRQSFLGKLNGHVEEMLGSHVVVKAFGGEDASVAVFETYNDALYTSAWKANFLSGLMMPVTLFIGNLGYVGVCIVGGYLTANGQLTVGGIQSFIQYVRSFTQPLSQMANISNVLQQTAAGAERVFEFLNEPEQAGVLESVPCEVGAPHAHVCFNHVRFGYDDAAPVIKNFSACIGHGKKVAIVGPTGAGKTTIVKLLMRYYDVQEGCITIDGRDVRSMERQDLRRHFAMVLQDTWLFSGSIRENIRYGRLDATDSEVLKAAEAAQVDHFVRTLPAGYDMEINEEAGNVSQGQKQLLTIARAILADPEILILDEATSNVDTRTEVLIQRAMDHLMEGRTSFIIAHRLSTIRNADLILVMAHGDIIEQGTHETLLALGGAYADLYNSQFERSA